MPNLVLLHASVSCMDAKVHKSVLSFFPLSFDTFAFQLNALLVIIEKLEWMFALQAYGRCAESAHCNAQTVKMSC